MFDGTHKNRSHPAPTFALQIAKVRRIYPVAAVERKLDNGDSREYVSLRSTYERMLEPRENAVPTDGSVWKRVAAPTGYPVDKRSTTRLCQ